MRFLLGFFECGLFPGISFFLSGWYKVRNARHRLRHSGVARQARLSDSPLSQRREMSKRISVFFAGAVLAGAFGGILGCECSGVCSGRPSVLLNSTSRPRGSDGLSRMEGIGGKAGWSWIVSPPFFFPFAGPSP
jgi:hypothetical protein